MNFYFIGEECRDTPHDIKGCHYWTYFPKQNGTCFLLNSCADLVVSNHTEVFSGDRDCDPTDFILALGETLEKNIVALKEAKTAVERFVDVQVPPEPYRKRKVRAAANDCTEFTVFVNQRKFLKKITNDIIFTLIIIIHYF